MTFAFVAEPFGAAEWREFFAHLHPLLLHLPIGLLAGALLLEVVSWFSRGSATARRWVNVAFAVTAVLAASSGWLLGEGDDYGGELIERHRKLGIGAAAAALWVGLFDVCGRSGKAAFARRLGLLAAAALVGAAGHQGGMFTHGRTFLSAHAPEWLAPWVGVVRSDTPAPVDVPPSDVEIDAEPEPPQEAPPEPEPEPQPLASVVAAFRERCLECHNEEKTKGGLRLDIVEGWTETIDHDDPLESELLYRVQLPGDDPDAMPPKGDRLAPDVLDALREWIESGAPEEALRAELALVHGAAAREAQRVAAATDPLGAAVRSLGAGEELSVSWAHVDAIPTAERLAALGPIAGQVTELSLAGRELHSEALASLPMFPNLRRVHLERTAVDDAGVAHLVERAPGVRYLNLHSTAVTPEVRRVVEPLAELRELVLFDTAAAESTGDPFASLASAQPRRILVASEDKSKVLLFRELALGAATVLWGRDAPAGTRAAWVDESRGGHGYVQLAAPGQPVVELDTATDEQRPISVPWSEPDEAQELSNGNRVRWNVASDEGEPHAVETAPNGAVVWTFEDREQLGSRLSSLVVIERTRDR